MAHPLKGLVYSHMVEATVEQLETPLARSNFRVWDATGLLPQAFHVFFVNRDGTPQSKVAQVVYTPWRKRGFVYFKSERWDFSGPTALDVVRVWLANLRAKERE